MAIRTGVPQFLCYVTFCKWNGSYPSSYVMLPFENLFIQGLNFYSDTYPASVFFILGEAAWGPWAQASPRMKKTEAGSVSESKFFDPE